MTMGSLLTIPSSSGSTVACPTARAFFSKISRGLIVFSIVIVRPIAVDSFGVTVYTKGYTTFSALPIDAASSSSPGAGSEKRISKTITLASDSANISINCA